MSFCRKKADHNLELDVIYDIIIIVAYIFLFKNVCFCIYFFV